MLPCRAQPASPTESTGHRQEASSFPGPLDCSLLARNNRDWFLDSRFPAWSCPRGHTPVPAPAWRARATKACTLHSQSPSICLWPALPISGAGGAQEKDMVCVQEGGQVRGSCASGTMVSRMTLCAEKTGVHRGVPECAQKPPRLLKGVLLPLPQRGRFRRGISLNSLQV